MDPREFFKQPRNSNPDHKTLQLCRQVARTVDLVLSGECHGEALQGLQVVQVTPAPNCGQLCITLGTILDATHTPELVLQSLAEVEGLLRCPNRSGYFA